MLTLIGVTFSVGGSIQDAAVVVSPTLGSPAGSWAANGTIFDTDESGPTNAVAQIIVLNAVGVTISHITVDAANNGYDCSLGILIGIYYQNSTGTVTDSVARNQNIGNGDQCGWGIAAESNSGAPALTVSNNSVRNFQKNGIVVRGDNTNGPALTATGNTVIGIGATSQLAQNGIEVAFGATGTVKTNYVADVQYTGASAATGILFYASAASAANVVESNVVESTNYGVGVSFDPSFGGGGSGVIVNTNHIGGTQVYDGIDLCGANETAKTNLIYGSTESGINIDNTCGGSSGTGDTVTGNTINEACAGILYGTGTAPTSNTYENDGYETLSGNTCTLPAGPQNNVKGSKTEQPTAKSRKARP